ncbi:MAG: hypothetical protein IKK14_08920 [Oscillospiraceae bacterium]|nr:hypothetical protein [Oscillospiraceae bacterium]
MKKILVVLLSLLMLFSFASCDSISKEEKESLESAIVLKSYMYCVSTYQNILSTSCNYMNITPNELDGYDLYGELSIRTMDGNRYTVDFGAIAWIDENGEVKLENFNLVGDPVLNNY